MCKFVNIFVAVVFSFDNVFLALVMLHALARAAMFISWAAAQGVGFRCRVSFPWRVASLSLWVLPWFSGIYFVLAVFVRRLSPPCGPRICTRERLRVVLGWGLIVGLVAALRVHRAYLISRAAVENDNLLRLKTAQG